MVGDSTMKCPTSGARTKSVSYHRFRWSRLITSNRGSIKVGQATILLNSWVHCLVLTLCHPCFQNLFHRRRKKQDRTKALELVLHLIKVVSSLYKMHILLKVCFQNIQRQNNTKYLPNFHISWALFLQTKREALRAFQAWENFYDWV